VIFHDPQDRQAQGNSLPVERDIILSKISWALAEIESKENHWSGTFQDATSGKVKDTRLWSIKRDAAQYLKELILQNQYSSILEFGTSAGYSTLHLAEACLRTHGTIDTIERDPQKIQLAQFYFDAIQSGSLITLHEGDIPSVLSSQLKNRKFDFIFIDGAQEEYPKYLNLALEHLSPYKGTIVADNVISHADALAPFFKAVAKLQRYTVSKLPIGSGLLRINQIISPNT
jgi:predicted O-methyltransferase YrrM